MENPGLFYFLLGATIATVGVFLVWKYRSRK